MFLRRKKIKCIQIFPRHQQFFPVSLLNIVKLLQYLISIFMFANGPEDLGSIPGRVIPKTQKMVLDASLLNTQHYKVRIKGKVEQSRERSSALPYTLLL